MTTAAGQYPVIGQQPAGNFNNAVEVSTGTGYVPLVKVGTIMAFQDPYFGGLEVIRLSVPVSTAVKVGNVAVWDSAYSYVAVPSTAALGQPVAISLSSVPSNASNVQYGWFVISGTYVVASAASITAATAAYIGTAGLITGSQANGKQILNIKTQVAATTTVVKTAQLLGGNVNIKVTNTDGWFVGAAITGTGIPASTVISTIDQNNNMVTLNNAPTAGGSVSITATYNDGTTYWNVCTVDRPFAQGQVV